MLNRESKKFYISVEGYTEELYFKRLQSLISNQDARYRLSLNLKQNKSPKKFIKNMPLVEAECFHIFDYESNSPEHKLLFENTLKEISEVNEKYSKKISCKAGYSNISFDLWILLHKVKFTSPVSNCNQYLPLINKAYNTNFESMNKYKQEENFKKQILSKITLADVLQAIKYAKEIRMANEQNAKEFHTIYGVKYYAGNPDLTIHECVEKMLEECGIVKP
jgi:hypothetical protein